MCPQRIKNKIFSTIASLSGGSFKSQRDHSRKQKTPVNTGVFAFLDPLWETCGKHLQIFILLPLITLHCF